ncbi:DUF2288 domain-containing protein [Sediminicurvatus halobius]|uniref:DUF2288 domain-containing protein n=1 Tax=Sediminicurvatus halobius TaxID=2182432 RepID=A0A2U2MZZ1_9GAMM|nr:DUF2288 domain-containing protein [Spiribacter halobius]PWG62565.1 DUF2288 domain-containing protein [Spiribacter halobius]UEX78521.1 DUF2288 domain-containing protein [Spiribacter halobius]
MTDPQEPDLETRLNTETGRISWAELERHFARGSVVRVAPNLDLVAVAAAFVRDDRPKVEVWLTSGEVRKATGEDAADWNRRDPALWAVVAAPWVLVQEPDR